MDLYVRLCRDEVGCHRGGIVVMVEENLAAQRSSHSSILVSKPSKKSSRASENQYSQRTLLDRERDREKNET